MQNGKTKTHNTRAGRRDTHQGLLRPHRSPTIRFYSDYFITGDTYYWFCVAYKDDDGDKTYYSVIAEETDDGREVVSAEEVDGPFVCCNLEEFSEMLDGK